MIKLKILLFLIIFIPSLHADEYNISNIAKELNLSAGSKAIAQWERVFKSKKKMKRYKIDTLNSEDQNFLKEYLIKHAIDSDQPTIAGV